MNNKAIILTNEEIILLIRARLIIAQDAEQYDGLFGHTELNHNGQEWQDMYTTAMHRANELLACMDPADHERVFYRTQADVFKYWMASYDREYMLMEPRAVLLGLVDTKSVGDSSLSGVGIEDPDTTLDALQ